MFDIETFKEINPDFKGVISSYIDTLDIKKGQIKVLIRSIDDYIEFVSEYIKYSKLKNIANNSIGWEGELNRLRKGVLPKPWSNNLNTDRYLLLEDNWLYQSYNIDCNDIVYAYVRNKYVVDLI